MAEIEATVRIPTQLRTLTGGQEEVKVQGVTVGEVIDALGRAHPGMRERLLDDKGAVRRFVNVFVGDEDIRFLEGLSTPLRGGEQISIVPAIAGGRG